MQHSRIPHSLHAISRALALLTFLVLASAGWGKVVYVNKNAPGATHDGAAWATAFKTVQPAIDAAQEGDEVWVTADTYLENITLNKGVALYGGLAGTETQRSQRDWKANVTILDGNQTDAVVTVPSSVTSPFTVDGFTIRNGSASYWSGRVYITGGGVYIQGGAATIANDIISGNGSFGLTADGGASVALRNSRVFGNGKMA